MRERFASSVSLTILLRAPRHQPQPTLSCQAGLESYLQNLILNVPNWPKLAEFLSSDMKTVKEKSSVDTVVQASFSEIVICYDPHTF